MGVNICGTCEYYEKVTAGPATGKFACFKKSGEMYLLQRVIEDPGYVPTKDCHVPQKEELKIMGIDKTYRFVSEKDGMEPIQPCFECKKDVFIASYHLEPGEEYPKKYPVMFCDETCREAFIKHIAFIIAEEM